jgi:sterol carrier protein 2
MEPLVCARRSVGTRSIHTVATSSSKAEDFKTKAVFDAIGEELKKNGADYVKKINGVFCFKVKNGESEGTWVVDVKNGTGFVKFDPSGKGDVTITMEDENLLNLMLGKLNPQQAFFQGKLKIGGNMGLAMKLQQLKPSTLQSKL